MTNNGFIVRENPEYNRNRRFPSLTMSGIALMIFLFLFFGASVVLSVMVVSKPELMQSYGFNMINIIVSQLLCMLPPVLIAMQISRCDFLSSLRLRKGVNAVQAIILLAVAGGAFFFTNGINNIFVLLLESLGYVTSSDSFTITTDGQLIFSALLYGILPAFCEEFFFRGLVLRSFERFSPAAAVMMSSLLFGLMHGNLQQVLFAAVFGVILAVVVLVTDSIVPAMILHFTNNFAAMILTYLPGLMNMQEEAEQAYTAADIFISSGVWVVLGAFILLASLTGYIFYTRRRNRIKYGYSKPEELTYGFAGVLDSQRYYTDSCGFTRFENRAGKHPVLAYLMLGGFIAAECVMLMLDFIISHA